MQKIGIFDPKDVAADTVAVSATDHHGPRVEAQITWNGDFFQTGVGVNLWVDGTYQSTGRTTAEIAARKAIATATEANMEDEDESVESAGVGFGTKTYLRRILTSSYRFLCFWSWYERSTLTFTYQTNW